ncbi:hypothetical protein [Ignicoccus hospitalis]|uniref:Uncharacterized protein n=1 Tax=Ignicoccus hospitalis (strain KIN4/I / DSM 18386 / JCM 14125) TaxID=453591 RepID=A8ABA3_IGNH4|nr:hypothetical protein [Ignicoccus hospitalis]ABU82205.1 hypothetical protein Igni_1026 [Ignicoccus hospitalis KIN4/I]HIH91163.1 hypothetical protein [Desulfurococcaceae archaeon]
MAIVFDLYPSGSILEAEFARNAGVPAVRLGCSAGYLCYEEGPKTTGAES